MQRITVLTIVLLCAFPAAAANEVQLGWRTLVEYDSLLFPADGGRDDFIFTMGPVFRLNGERRKMDYEIRHFSGYEKYQDLSELDNWRHEMTARLGYNLSPRVRLELSNRFSSIPTLRTSTVDSVDPGDPAPDPGVTPDDSLRVDAGAVLINVLTLGMTTVPFPRVTTSTQFTYLYQEFDDPTLNNQNTQSTTVLTQADYRLDENHRVGAGFRYSFRDFETVLNESQVSNFEAFATWDWAVDGRSNFTARIGPSWAADDPDDPMDPLQPLYPVNDDGAIDWETCDTLPLAPGVNAPVLGPACGVFDQMLSDADRAFLESFGDAGLDLPSIDNDDNAVNLFYLFTLDRRWERFRLSASWSRSDSQTQGLGSQTLVDSVFLNSRYDLTEKVRFWASFRFTRRSDDVSSERSVVLLRPEDVTLAGDSGDILASESVAAVVFDQSFTQTRNTFNLRLRLVRDWGRESNAFISLNLRRQQNELDSEVDALDFDDEFNSWQIVIGVTYRFRPFRF